MTSKTDAAARGVHPHGAEAASTSVAARRGAVRRLLLFSWVCMVAEVLTTRFPAGDVESSRAAWIVFGSLLLWAVYRGSRTAWTVTAILALFGGVLFAVGAPTDSWAAVMCALCLGQALPLLTRAVRRHVS